MLREYTAHDFGELMRLRCLLYPNHSEQELHAELMAFFYSSHRNSFRNYDLWTSFVYQRQHGGLGGFIDIGFVCADEYLERLVHFVDTDYFDQIQRILSSGCPIPVVESWYVDEDLRGNRIGFQLMQQAEQWVKDEGYPFILSDTDDFRDVSKKIHQSYGYTMYHVDDDRCHYFYKSIT